MAELPVEIVEIIFKYLITLEDRKSASQVCQQWYQAYLNPYFRLHEIVHFTSEKQLRMFTEIDNSYRHYLNFVMTNVDITSESLPFWQKCGRYIRNLTINRCYVREKMFVKALSRCYRLESLTVHDCKELLMSGLLLDNQDDQMKLKKAWVNLKTLSFSYNRYLSDAILVKVLALCPGISSLILTGCQISYHNGMFHKFYPKGLNNPSESVTTFKVIQRYIQNNAKRIKTLSLSDTLLDGNSLYILSLTEKLDLRGLQLRSCMQITNQGLMQMCTTSNLKDLTELDVGLCPRITDTSLIILCSSLRQLKKFSVQGCRAITDMGLANIWQMDKLESLNLAECESIHGPGILKGICYKVNYNLKEIWLSHMGNISEATIIGMVEMLPNLRHMDLSYCYNAVTDVSLQSVFKHSRWLRRLNIAMCNRVTDCGLTGMGVSDKPVKPSVNQLLYMPLGSKHELQIMRDAKLKEEVRVLCESELLEAKKTGVSLASLRGLQHLGLSGCNRVSDVSLKYALDLPELQSLVISHLQQISKEGMLHIVSKCPALEDLDLDMCQNIDDEAIGVVLRSLPRLKRLVLGSDKITNDIGDLIRSHGLKLAYIDLIHCRKVTGPGVGDLSLYLPHLKSYTVPEVPVETERVVPPPPMGLWINRS